MNRRKFFTALGAAIASPKILENMQIPQLFMGIDPASESSFSVSTSAAAIQFTQDGIKEITYGKLYKDPYPLGEANHMKSDQDFINKCFEESLNNSPIFP